MPPIPSTPHGALLYIDQHGDPATVDPPPNDGQRYVLTFSFPQTRPVWIGLGGFGFSYGNQYGGSSL